MKANELMIGDWVLHDGEPYQIRQLGIYGVDRDGEDYPAVCVGKPKGVGLIVERNEIEPIPLSTEILEKNEFEKQWQDNYEFFDDDENLNITFHPKSSNYTNGVYDYIDIEKGCLTINEMPITFVHELQHVLILCESKKEIIL